MEYFTTLILVLLSCRTVSALTKEIMMVRMAEINIEPSQLEAYKKLLRDGAK